VIVFEVAFDAANTTVSTSDVVDVDESTEVNVTLPEASVTAVVATGLLRPLVVIVTVCPAHAAPNLSLSVAVIATPPPAATWYLLPADVGVIVNVAPDATRVEEVTTYVVDAARPTVVDAVPAGMITFTRFVLVANAAALIAKLMLKPSVVAAVEYATS